MDGPIGSKRRRLAVVSEPTSRVQPGRALHVALIHLPTVTAPQSLSYYGAIPPLGLAYLAAVTRRAGHCVQVIDASGEALDRFTRRATPVGDVLVQGLTVAEIVARIADESDVVGISNMFLHQWPLLRELVAAIRAARPELAIVVGGENATAFWSTMMDQAPAIDLCVLGEGEATLLAVLAVLSRDRDKSHAHTQTRSPEILQIPGLAVHGSGGPQCTPSATRVRDLDGLPRPAWDLFPVAAYLERGHGSGVHRGRSMPVLTSRGCPYQCTFCSSPQMWTTRYLRRDPEDVADEIEELVHRFQVTNIDINDLTAMLTKDWILEFCRVLTGRGLGVSWQLPSGTRSEAVDAEAAQALFLAGCRNFTYAPESGSADTLRRIKKKVKLPALRASLRASIQAGLATHCSIIIGFPHERPRDLWATYKFVLQLAVDGLETVAVMVFAPYPGSEEYDALRERGAIELGEPYYYSSLLRASSGMRSFHPLLGPRQLFTVQLFYLCSFYGLQYTLRPWRLVRSVANAASGRHNSVMDQFLATKARQMARSIRARTAAIRRRFLSR